MSIFMWRRLASSLLRAGASAAEPELPRPAKRRVGRPRREVPLGDRARKVRELELGLPPLLPKRGRRDVPRTTRPGMYELVRPNVYLDLVIGQRGEPQRMVLELFDRDAPITAHNFRTLCNGRVNFGYHNTTLHYLVPGKLLAGGRFSISGKPARCAFGPVLPREAPVRRHDAPGLLSMLVDPVHGTSATEFIITLDALPHLDEQQVVFGHVLHGTHVLSQLAHANQVDGVPLPELRIIACGEA